MPAGTLYSKYEGYCFCSGSHYQINGDKRYQVLGLGIEWHTIEFDKGYSQWDGAPEVTPGLDLIGCRHYYQ